MGIFPWQLLIVGAVVAVVRPQMLAQGTLMLHVVLHKAMAVVVQKY